MALLTLLLLFVQPGEAYIASHANSRTRFQRTRSRCFMVPKKVKRPAPESLRSRKNSTDLLYAASILDDGKGQINRDLAESIWNWEHEQREKSHLPHFDFSTRRGLRLVDEIARGLLADWRSDQQKQTDSSPYHVIDQGSFQDPSEGDASYSDLVQDGVVALMYAMARYDGPPEKFEEFARESITQQLSRALAKEVSPIRWPKQVVKIWRVAQLERGQFLLEMGREPTAPELASRLNITTRQLEVCQQANREAISMERTVEIYDPWLEASAKFADQDDWDKQRVLLLDHGDHILSDDTVEDLVDETMQYEGEDEMWVHHEQIVAPLREFIPDDEADPDDIVLNEMIRLGVNDLVERTLNRAEKQVIRLRYGIGSTPTMSQREVANLWGVAINVVRRLEERALQKLRASYQNRYVDSHDESTEDSV